MHEALNAAAVTASSRAETATSVIMDTGASEHIENRDGEPGFTSRRPTDITISTGLTVNTTADWVGTHEMYMLGPPPVYNIVHVVRTECHHALILSQVPLQPSRCFS